MSTIRVRRFDPKTIKESRIIFIIGKRHTGKSVLMKDLLYHMPRADFTLAMAPTEDTLRVFREFLPESCIFDHFSQEKLERTVSLQKELVSRGKRRTVCIILDDCLYQKGILRSNAMRSIFFNGRHDNITLICAAQYMMEVDVSLRSNIDYIFTMRETILTNRQKLFKHYFGQFSNFNDFEKVMQACTQDYRSLVLDGTVSTVKSPTDCVMWYKASPELPPFRLCKDMYWRMANRFCLSKDAMRQAKHRKFELQNAVMDTINQTSQPEVKRPEAGKRSTASGIVLVQTEDAEGNVVPAPD